MMKYTLNSPHFEFVLNPELATWSLHGRHPHAPFIEDAWMRVSYRCRKKTFEALQKLESAEIHTGQTIDSPHGPLDLITLNLGPDKNGLCYRIEFALSEDHPLFLWRLSLDHQGEETLEIKQLKLLQAGFFPKRKRLPTPGVLTNRYQEKPKNIGTVRPYPSPGDLVFFANGWQSWSFTGMLSKSDRYQNTNLGCFAQPMWYHHPLPRFRKPRHFSGDMFGAICDRQYRSGILAGFLSQKQHFGSLEAYTDPLYPALALWANGDNVHLLPGSQMTTDWAVIQFIDLAHPDPLGSYLEAVAREHLLAPRDYSHHPSVGWCSWYQFYQDISDEKIRDNLRSAAEQKSKIPFDLFQIDDGFQSQIGDWFEFSPEFPNGVKPLAASISDHGFMPGLWLAPFIVHTKAKLKHQHPDWLLRNRWGFPVNAGFVWNNFNKALDLTHPEALGYTQEVVRTAVHEWGFHFLKLDFLYAAALPGQHHDRTKTRAQVLRMGLEMIRETVGSEIHLLGCGTPLGPSIGIFDSMRIGADVDPNWHPSFFNIKRLFRNEYAMPSTRNAIQNALTRSAMHKRWWINDPDCLLVRPDSNLTLAEVQSLATVIALTDGPLLVSDDLPKLPPERFRIAQQLVPKMGQRPRVLDCFDAVTPRRLRLDLENAAESWHLVAVFNWEDQTEAITIHLSDFSIAPGQYFAREFWSGNTAKISDELPLKLNTLPHGVKLLALRPIRSEKACYLGSDLHISQGLEVTQWSETPSNLNFHLERPGISLGQVDLYLPNTPSKISVNQSETEWQLLEKDCYRLQLNFNQTAVIEVL